MNNNMNNNEDKRSDNSGEQTMIAIENGSVLFSGSPVPGDSGALIRCGKGVILVVNGKEVKGACEIFPADQVEIKPIEETEPDRVEVRISGDQLSAEARFLPGVKRKHRVKDHPYTGELTVEAEPYEENYQSLAGKDILEIITKNGVTYGLDQNAPTTLIKEPGAWHLVATGKRVQQGRDGWIEVLFKSGFKSVSYEDQEKKVDFRDRYELVQVKLGDVMAVIHPPVPGEPGIKVTGQEIQPDPVTRAEVNCESGAELDQESRKVLATQTGVPYFKKGRTSSFSVENIYIHKGDVDIKSGNIDFRGHFKVQGAITEGMKVSADGNIEIGDNASGAEILAGGNIIFKKNCIKCIVQAGWVDMVLNDLYATLDKMADSVERALDACDDVAKTLEEKGKYSEQMETAVVRSLLQNKFTELPQYAYELLNKSKKAFKSLPENLVQAVNETAPYFVDYQYVQSLGRPVLQDIHHKLLKLKEGRESRSERADITVSYVQNSKLTCTGDVLVKGQGVYNSSITCKGVVKIDRLFRGGSIDAGGDVYIGEAGSPRSSSEQEKISIPYQGTVYLGKAYENLRIKFGATEYRCIKELRNARLILDQQEFEVKILSWTK